MPYFFRQWSIFNNDSQAYRSTLRERKMSLVGKPLRYRNYRTDAHFRRMQSSVHNFLERPRGWRAASYHLAVLVMVLMCLALSVFSTMPDFEEYATLVLYYLEIFFVIWLAIEYICRVWSAGCRSRYRGIAGRIRFATSAYCVIDIIVIMASIIVLCIGATGQVFAASAIRGLRFFQILRMLRIDRRAGTWKLLGSVIWAHRQELLTTLYIGFLGLFFASFLMYIFEKNTNKKYATFADALWWGVITVSTVGYGDKSPETWPGKIIGAICALMGISFCALPSARIFLRSHRILQGILGSGFALKVQQHQRQKHLIRRRIPAARLIQCLWRHYSAAPESISVATWKVHVVRRSQSPKPKTSSGNGNPTSFMNRIRQSARRRPNDPLSRSQENNSTVASLPIMKTLLVPTLSDNLSMVSASELDRLGAVGFSMGHWRSKDKSSGSAVKRHSNSTINNRLTTSSFFGQAETERRIESEAAAASRHRRSLTLCRLLPGEIATDNSLLMAPLYKWCERFRNHLDKEEDNDEDGSVWTKLAGCAPPCISIDTDEESANFRPASIDELTPVVRNVIRAIRRIQVLVARRKFKEALKPYDVKDIIEQYSAGHVDLQSRVKGVQHKLNQILGKPTAKENPKNPLVNNVIHIEQTFDRIDDKLDLLMEMFKEDRKKQSRSASPLHPVLTRVRETSEGAKYRQCSEDLGLKTARHRSFL